jgi:nucleotide-binding universal stress UspA family protein
MSNHGLPQLVVGYDRKRASERALVAADYLATKLSARLHIVHVVDLLDYPVDPESSDWEMRAQRTLDEERVRVSALMENSTNEWEYHSESGEPVRALLALANRNDALMIVVGTRGEGFGGSLQRLLGGGSVSHGLIRNRDRPVLVVP